MGVNWWVVVRMSAYQLDLLVEVVGGDAHPELAAQRRLLEEGDDLKVMTCQCTQWVGTFFLAGRGVFAMEEVSSGFVLLGCLLGCATFGACSFSGFGGAACWTTEAGFSFLALAVGGGICWAGDDPVFFLLPKFWRSSMKTFSSGSVS